MQAFSSGEEKEKEQREGKSFTGMVPEQVRNYIEVVKKAPQIVQIQQSLSEARGGDKVLLLCFRQGNLGPLLLLLRHVCRRAMRELRMSSRNGGSVQVYVP
jgi:hypothetical protein